MAETIDPEAARSQFFESIPVDLWKLARALDPNGAAFPGGVSPRMVIDLLEVGETENWPSSRRKTTGTQAFFGPLFTYPKDGKVYRSFLPEDLADKDEAPLRQLAEATGNPLVKARLYEVLWDRFHRFPDAQAAIAARFASAELGDPENDWPGLVKNLGRLTTLILSINAQERIPDLILALEKAAIPLAWSSRSFSVAALADMICNTLLKKPEGRTKFGDARGHQWTRFLQAVASRYLDDPNHIEHMLLVLQAWKSVFGDLDGAESTRRDLVAALRSLAKSADPKIAPSFAQRALDLALDFGLSDLTGAIRLDLSEVIRAAIPTFGVASQSFSLPPEIVSQIDSICANSSSASAAVRRLSVLAGLLEVDLGAIAENWKSEGENSLFLAMIPKVQFHPDGKVTHRSRGLEDATEFQTSLYLTSHLAHVQAILHYFLSKVGSEFDEDTLLEALEAWPHLPAHRRALLQRASERFCAGDWISSTYVVATTYEAVVRDLLRAGGYPAMKLEPGGIQMDETLTSLVRSEAMRAVLGVPYCDFVSYVMCDPAGWNLRNEIAHGTVRPDSLGAEPALLVWLLLVRVSCFVAT